VQIKDYASSNSQRYVSRKERNNKSGYKLLKIPLFFILFIITFSLIFAQVKNLNLMKTRRQVLGVITKITNINLDDGLQRTVSDSLKGSKGTYAVVIKNLTSGESYYFNEHKKFEAASLYKNWIMVTVFRQIESGKITKGEILKKDIAELNKEFEISTKSAEMTEGEIEVPVIQALIGMITISHNYNALLLADRIKLSSVRNFLTEVGLNESSVGSPPITSAYDMSLFFEKLYKGELGNSESTKEMIDLLKKQTLNNKIPRLLPEDLIIAHKTGELGSFTHDAGIVYTPKGNYIVVVLSESDYPPGAEEYIAKISKAVYDYFSSE
jgi:beta-lactamase class A